MTKEFAKQVLAIPTTSGKEQMMQEFIMDWAREHGVKASKDSKGNIYLEKGGAVFFPCLTSHMDTVHHDQEKYIEKNEMLPIEELGDVIKVKGGGVGADCKAGIAICLSMVERLSAVKAAFFVEEEIGMAGSRHLDKSFFTDVSYVIGFDSPDRNRATKACSGTLLFDDEFFNKYIKDVCREHGVTDFRYEPYTDVKQIREQTEIICMNFGNGGYNAHSKTEYVKFSEMNAAEEMGMALVAAIPADVQHKTPVKSQWDDRGSSKFPSFSRYFGGYSADDDDDLDDPADLSMYSDLDPCSIKLTFDDKDQYDLFDGLVGKEGLGVDISEFKQYDIDFDDGEANISGFFGEVKDAYVLWYQVYYDRPDLKTWEDLEDADSEAVEDFANDISVSKPKAQAAKKPQAAKKKEEEQLTFWDWIEQRKRENKESSFGHKTDVFGPKP